MLEDQRWMFNNVLYLTTSVDEFIVKVSQRYNVSVLIDHHQDLRKDDTE